MPVYELLHSGIPLTAADRRRIARGITEIHHDETHAPEPFVRVVFTPLPLGTVYMAGEVAPSVLLNCGIRVGRSAATRQSIIRRCYDLLAEVTQAPPDQLFVVATEGESSWIMEAGFFLPEPNDAAEAAWIHQLQEAYPGRYDDWAAGNRPSYATDSHARSERRRQLAKDETKQLARAAGLTGKTTGSRTSHDQTDGHPS